MIFNRSKRNVLITAIIGLILAFGFSIGTNMYNAHQAEVASANLARINEAAKHAVNNDNEATTNSNKPDNAILDDKSKSKLNGYKDAAESAVKSAAKKTSDVVSQAQTDKSVTINGKKYTANTVIHSLPDTKQSKEMIAEISKKLGATFVQIKDKTSNSISGYFKK